MMRMGRGFKNSSLWLNPKQLRRSNLNITETDANTYANAASSITNITLSDGSPIKITMSKENKSYYVYETENNDSKRTIKLLKQEFIPAVEEEFRRVIK